MDNEDYAPREILHGASTSTLGTVLLFGTVIFCTSSLAARLWLTGTWSRRSGPAAEDGGGGGAKGRATTRSAPLDASSLPSVYALLVHSTSLGLILLYSYLCENHPPHHHGTKTYDRDEFFFWTVLVVVFAGGQSLRRNIDIRYKGRDVSRSEIVARHISEHRGSALPPPETEVLNRYQTEEWKGWMQFTFLLYHYMHAVEVYNSIRVMITCYVWMTGFGNFSFFYTTGDYSLPRVMQMLWRLNFLVAFLCLTHGNSYMLYYICPLHTYYFAVVYLTMCVRKEKNHTKWWVRLKLGVLACVIYAVWDVDSPLFGAIHGPFLSDEPVTGATMGTFWEWYFRSYLDHWSTLLGMVFALNFPIASLYFRSLEAGPARRQWLGKLPVAAALVGSTCVWAAGPFLYDKLRYNSTNPYFGFVPLLTYIYVRNLTPTMRSFSMDFLHEIGKTTLETYLMQHHIWLTSNSKTVLVWLPGWPRMNLAIVTYVYVKVARKLHSLTLHLRGMLLPDDKAACVRSAVGLFTAVAGCYCAAFALESAGLASLSVLGLASMLCGFLLYQSVVDSTWSSFAASARKDRAAMDGAGDDDAEEDMFVNDYDTVPSRDGQSHVRAGAGGSPARESAYTRFCPPLIGSMSLIMLGVIWNCFATSGSSAIGPLPRICDAHVNEGMWVAIDGCNEASEGMAYRDHRAEIFGTCAPHGNSFIWAWKKSRCRFGHRSEAMVRRVLQGRNVVFIGDSMTRYVYHATMRGLGIPKSGEYDATGPKHADIYNTLWGTTAVNFKWAPLATDQLGALEEVNRKATEEINQADDHPVPDLIFLGGGAWDRLHVYATDEDRRSHSSTLKQLAFEMQRARDEYSAAVVWFIPTTINSQALNTEEKRDHMREEDMEAMRAVYSRNGILSSSSFVIDGPAFTSSRVGESYDGVHYPIQVYSAGAQILFNALDWLLPPGYDEQRMPPRVGKMADPVLGFFMIVLVLIGLVGFDSFLGFSYLSSLFVRNIMPMDLYEESFSALHRKIGVASPIASKSQPPETQMVSRNEKIREGIYGRRNGNISNIVDDEIASLLDKARDDGSFASQPSM